MSAGDRAEASDTYAIDTILAQAGRCPSEHEGAVNIPIYRLQGDESQTCHAFAQALTILEKGRDTILTASGVAARTLIMDACLEPGDEVLIAATAGSNILSYGQNVLRRRNIGCRSFDAHDPAALKAMMTGRTRLVYLASPGLTWPLYSDVAGIADIARSQGHSQNCYVAVDSTLATPLVATPLVDGADMVVHDVGGLIAGHADVEMGGVVVADTELAGRLTRHAKARGDRATPDEAFLAARGLRTLGVRLRRQSQNLQKVADWLSLRQDVADVFVPPVPDGAAAQNIGDQYSRSSTVVFFTLARDVNLTDDSLVHGRLQTGCFQDDQSDGRAGLYRIKAGEKHINNSALSGGPCFFIPGWEESDRILADLEVILGKTSVS